MCAALIFYTGYIRLRYKKICDTVNNLRKVVKYEADAKTKCHSDNKNATVPLS